MIESFGDLMMYAGAGTAGGGSAAGVLYYMMQRLFKRQDKLEDEVKRLRDEQIKSLETQVVDIRDGIIDSEKSAAKHQEKQENLLGWMKKVDMKLDVVQASSSKMQGIIENQATWLKDMNEDIRRHIADYNIHHPKK